MPSMRRRAGALVIVAAFGLTACGGPDGAEQVAAPAAPEPAPAEAEEAPGADADRAEADGAEDVDRYWSSERLAALEAAKKSYVAPTPAPTPEAGAGAEAPAAVDPTSTEPVPATTGEAVPAAERYRIAGYVDVPDHVWLREYSDGEPEDGGKCRRGQEGYEDVKPGTSVEVGDGDGSTLATGTLEKGTLITSYEDDVGRAMDCRLPFTVEDVPAAPSYTIALEGRGELTYAFADLERQGWQVAFSIDW